MAIIQGTKARVILDSRGNETLEVDVLLDDGTLGRVSVPSGASTGSHEAYKIQDMRQSVQNIKSLTTQIVGLDPAQQERVDSILLQTDGTEDNSKMGANVILALSLATASAAARSMKKPLHTHLHSIAGLQAPERMPTPMFNIINGGKHADNNLEFQEFMVVPSPDTSSFREKVTIGRTVFHTLKKILHQMGHSTSVGDEGGFAPRLNSNQEAIELIVEAIRATEYQPRTNASVALDAAASSIPDLAAVTYPLDPIGYYDKLVTDYPIISLEDPLTEDDWQGWTKLTAQLGSKVMVVGDDLYTTNPKRLKEGIDRKATNAVIIKPDQIGSLTETFQTMRLAEQAGFHRVISHRSGETESTFIADLAVGTGAEFIKTGAPSRGERVAKYNQLLRIEEELLG